MRSVRTAPLRVAPVRGVTVLVLSRKINQRIMIGDDIEIVVVDIRGEQVQIGIKAPRDIPVHRLEVYDTIREANVEATRVEDDDLEHLQLKKPRHAAGGG
jgi:carbon storage regulator